MLIQSIHLNDLHDQVLEYKPRKIFILLIHILAIKLSKIYHITKVLLLKHRFLSGAI